LQVKKMADNLSGIGEAIRKASEAYVEAIAAVSKAVQNIAMQAGGSDRDRLQENWLRLARMGKDGMITAIEQAYEYWEREVRRTPASSATTQPSNPMDAWAENWRKATEAFTTGNWSEEARKQAESVQKIMAEGMRAWQRIWEPEKK
jgi:anaerobic ribonucleoside-triphosphate reductase